MRHQVEKRKLGRTTSHRKAMLKNLVTSLLEKEKVTTTAAKAKEARRLADKLITLGKKGDVHCRRRAYALLGNRTVVKVLFTEIAPLFQNRAGGYTRIIRGGNRTGDGAELAVLELVEKRPKAAPKPKPVKARPPTKPVPEEVERKGAPPKPRKERPSEVKEAPPKEAKPEAKEKPAEEKPPEEKKPRGFFGRLFRRRGKE